MVRRLACLRKQRPACGADHPRLSWRGGRRTPRRGPRTPRINSGREPVHANWGESTMSEEGEKKPFDKFELCAALLLGLGAVGAAVVTAKPRR